MHEILTFYNWLVANNMWRAVITWSVGFILGALATWWPWKRHRRAQSEAIDLLRTDTPGGLQALLAALQRLERLIENSTSEDKGQLP